MQKNRSFSKNLERWYLKNSRDLPWRNTQDPYKIWISEIMLQQTTVNTVLGYYTKWIERFPRIENVAKASLIDILRAWQGLGYYNRAKSIHKTSKIIVKKYGGMFPSTSDRLRKLPGFGPYTTGALLSLAFKKPYTIVDANVRRVMMRQLGLKGKADNSHDKKIYTYLEQIIPHKTPDIFNQALMELGALICHSNNPQCHQCPINKSCFAYNSNKQNIIPTQVKKKNELIHSVIAVIVHKGKYLIQQRPPTGLLADLWEFPGGKIKQRESQLKALKREIKEELGVNVSRADYFTLVNHAYTRYRVKLHVWFCKLDIYPKSNKKRRWITLKDFEQYPMPAGSVKIVNKLRSL